MRHKLFVFCAAAVWITLLPGVLQAQDSFVVKRVTVKADKGWQNSGIRLQPLQFYSIKAFGTWISGLESPRRGPEGDMSGTICGNALVGWIAEDRPALLNRGSYTKNVVQNIILLGREAFRRAFNEGFLWLAMGEWSGCEECLGEIEVIITAYN
jgi:hypothetical protein